MKRGRPPLPLRLVLAPLLALAAAAAAQEERHHQRAALGAYDAAREASGTSWQPEAGGMEGRHFAFGPWRAMAHGFAFGVCSDISGPRGGREGFATHMTMLGALRPWAGGTLGLRAMLSLEPALGRTGYPLLLQTGESADGVNHLIDRQHPHDLFMELSASFSRPLGERTSAFLYVGWPGEPALGPPAFMHRRSAAANPLAPLSHHWLDSTHITYGVVTAGVANRRFKLDASVFNGREPDAARWNFDRPRLDSNALRVTFNLGRAWSAQASTGWVKAPELLHPGIDERRHTVSVSWSPRLGDGRLDVTAAWGRKVRNRNLPNCFISSGCFSGRIPYPPNRTQDAQILEANLAVGARHNVFVRAERVEKDGLYPGFDPFHARVFPVGSVLGGYLWELPIGGPIGFRAGGAAGFGIVPEFIAPDFGGRRPRSLWLLAQARLR